MCIFAKQLRYVLHQHKKDLGSLYTVSVLSDTPGRLDVPVHAAGDLPEEDSDVEQKIQDDLEPAIELYEEALLCLDAARMAS